MLQLDKIVEQAIDAKHRATPPLTTQSNVETGKTEHTISLPASCNDLAWHPRSNYLAMACNEQYGIVRVFGL